MSYLTDLDAIRDQLAQRFPGWLIWYVPRATGKGATWCARPEPLLNAGTPEDLAAAIEAAGSARVTGQPG